MSERMSKWPSITTHRAATHCLAWHLFLFLVHLAGNVQSKQKLTFPVHSNLTFPLILSFLPYLLLLRLISFLALFLHVPRVAFLVTCTRLYKSPCRSVCLIVGLLVRTSVTLSFFFVILGYFQDRPTDMVTYGVACTRPLAIGLLLCPLYNKIPFSS